jgi:predicted phage terminase large subunit-like protein
VNEDNSINLTQQDIDDTKRKAYAHLKAVGWDNDTIRHLRRKCKTDKWFLAYSILGYTQLSESLHGDLCITLRETENWKYRMFLYPRSHFKTTIVTKTDGVQIILPDDLKDQPYPRSLGTDCRLLIAHEKRESAAGFLFDITQHFTVNPILTALFPECVPVLKKQRVNKFELELPRTKIWSEPTVFTMGVGGKNQGWHFNYIKLDDIYGAEAAASKAERETAIQWFDNVQSFLVTPKTDKIDIVGTRWAFDDIYNHAIKMYNGRDWSSNYKIQKGDKLYVAVRKAIEDNKPIFPENFELSDFEILKRNAKVWNAQYANDPSEGAAEFDQAWKRYYNNKGRDLVLFHGHDSQDSEIVPYESLDRIILVDPALENGLSGVVVTGTDAKSRIFILEATKKAFRTEELLNLIFSYAQKHRVRAVVVEKVVFSALYDPIITAEMRKRNIRFQLILHPVGKTEKIARVKQLANYFAAQQIWFNRAHADLIEEFDQFGATENYHLLDSLSMGPKYWKSGLNRRLIDKYQEAENALLQGMDKVGGYSKI